MALQIGATIILIDVVLPSHRMCLLYERKSRPLFGPEVTFFKYRTENRLFPPAYGKSPIFSFEKTYIRYDGKKYYFVLRVTAEKR